MGFDGALLGKLQHSTLQVLVKVNTSSWFVQSFNYNYWMCKMAKPYSFGISAQAHTWRACFALLVLCTKNMISYQHSALPQKLECFHGWTSNVQKHWPKREASKEEAKENMVVMTKDALDALLKDFTMLRMFTVIPAAERMSRLQCKMDGWWHFNDIISGGNDPSTWLMT